MNTMTKGWTVRLTGQFAD